MGDCGGWAVRAQTVGAVDDDRLPHLGRRYVQDWAGTVPYPKVGKCDRVCTVSTLLCVGRVPADGEYVVADGLMVI